jgi:PleD family two-component response regulator
VNDEIAITLCATRTHGSHALGCIGEMLRTSIAATPFAALSGQTLTASFGVSNNKRGSSFDEAYARADGTLYNAKREGRNAVRC